MQRIFQLKGWQVKSELSDSGRGSRPCRPLRRLPTSAGQPICVASGLVVMAGRPWRWSSTATRVNCSAGICRAAAKPRLLAARWNPWGMCVASKGQTIEKNLCSLDSEKKKL